MSQGENLAVVVGYCTEPELGKANNGEGATTLKFRVAANETVGRGDKRRQKTSWIPVIVWGTYAEKLSEHLNKGQLVSVRGKNRTWGGKGKPFGYNLEAESVSLLGSRKDLATDLPWDELEEVPIFDEEQATAPESEVNA